MSAPIHRIVDFQILLSGIGKKRRIVQRILKSLLQNVDDVLRRVRRQHERSAHLLLSKDEFEQALYPPATAPSSPPPEHSATGMRLQRKLHQDVDEMIRHPLRVARDEARIIDAADAFDFAALHGKRDIATALIAGDDFELGAEHFVHDGRKHDIGGSLAAAADDEFVF